MKKETVGILQMILCAALWSIAGILIKIIPWNGFVVASLRSLIAGLTILIYMLLSGKKLILCRKTIISGLLTGCVYLCFVVANKLTTSANAIVLQFTSPVFIVIFSALLFHQKVLRRDLVTVLLTLGGITLFFLDQLAPGYLLGNFIAIAAGIFMAFMYMTVGNMEGDARYSAILLGQTVTFLAGLPFVFITKPVFTISSAAAILTLGVFQLGIAYILYVRSSMTCPPLACCLLGVIEPLLNPVWVMIFDGETPGPFALAGGVIIIVTITVWCAVNAKADTAAC